MTLSPFEMGRLAVMQNAPLHYVERRIEQLDLPDDHHYGVSVEQQIVVARHGEKAKKPRAERDVLVPLGLFSKDRMPGLQVRSPDGTLLPLLKREDRIELSATIFAGNWSKQFFSHISRADEAAAKAAWISLWFSFRAVIGGSKRQGEIHVYRLERTLEEWSQSGAQPATIQRAALDLLSTEQFWLDIYSLAETRLMVATLRAVPGQTYIVTVNYTERFLYREYRRYKFRDLIHGHARATLSEYVRHILSWLGVISFPIARSVANLGQAASLAVVQSVPEGVEPVRYYWRSARHEADQGDPVSVDVTRAVAIKDLPPGNKPLDPLGEKDILIMDAQISPSTAIAATIGLAALLLVVSTYVYQALPGATSHGTGHSHSVLAALGKSVAQPTTEDRTILVGLGSVFAAIPAAITGALAYRGQSFVRRASRGPRILLAILSVLAAFFAVVVSLKNLGDLAEATAYILSIYSASLIGLFGFIWQGSRWRKTERSRCRKATEQVSPNECRRKQIRDALLWLSFWIFAVVVFARSQAVLQEKHFFTGEFPVNVWLALRSWF